MNKNQFDKRKEEARKRVSEMDAADGYAERHAFTILCALEAGIMRPETGAAFDAYVMLEDVAKAQQQLIRRISTENASSN